MPVLLQEYVARLDVPVQYPDLVGRGESTERLGHDAEDALRGEGSPGDDFVAKGAARQALHHEIGRRLLLAEVQDRHDVWMDQAAGDECLLLKAPPHAGQRQCLGPEDLHGDPTLEPLVEGVEDPSHPALAEHAVDAVATPEQ